MAFLDAEGATQVALVLADAASGNPKLEFVIAKTSRVRITLRATTEKSGPFTAMLEGTLTFRAAQPP